MIPGEIIAAAGEIELNAGHPTVTLEVSNSGDRPVQVGSHYHPFEAERRLVDQYMSSGRVLRLQPIFVSSLSQGA